MTDKKHRIRLNQEYRNKIAKRIELGLDQENTIEKEKYLYEHFQEQMPYGTQKARTGDPDEFIYDALENLGLPLGEQQL